MKTSYLKLLIILIAIGGAVLTVITFKKTYDSSEVSQLSYENILGVINDNRWAIGLLPNSKTLTNKEKHQVIEMVNLQANIAMMDNYKLETICNHNEAVRVKYREKLTESQARNLFGTDEKMVKKYTGTYHERIFRQFELKGCGGCHKEISIIKFSKCIRCHKHEDLVEKERLLLISEKNFLWVLNN